GVVVTVQADDDPGSRRDLAFLEGVAEDVHDVAVGLLGSIGVPGELGLIVADVANDEWPGLPLRPRALGGAHGGGRTGQDEQSEEERQGSYYERHAGSIPGG